MSTVRIRLYVGISTVFVLLTIVIVGSVVWNTYRETRLTALKNADVLFEEVTTKVVERVRARFDSVSAVINAIASVPTLSQKPTFDGLDHPGVSLLVEILDSTLHSYAVSIGYGDGSHLQITPTYGDPVILKAFLAPEQTSYVVRTITRDFDGQRKEYLRYLNAKRRLVGARTIVEPGYDPRDRPWYQLGLASARAEFTEPFVFYVINRPGLTVTRRIDGGGVLGLGITLDGFSEFLARQRFADRSTVFIFDRKGRLLAHPDPDLTTVSMGNPKNRDQVALANVLDSQAPLVRAIGEAYLESLAVGEDTRGEAVANDETHLYRLRSMSLAADSDLLVAVSAPLNDFTAPFLLIQKRNLVFAAIVLVFAIPIIIFVSRQISNKLVALERETERIRRFELRQPVEVDSLFREIHNLASAFASMKRSMNTFGRYVPKDLVRQILTTGGNAEVGGERRELTLLFTDVADFTTFSEEMDPEALMLHMSAYFEAMANAIASHHGVVDKYIGDAVMAIWNAPRLDLDHAARACAAALDCAAVNARLNGQWVTQGRPSLHTRFGIHTGQVVVGNIGGVERMNYTAVGAGVNAAARLEGLNKAYGTQILVSSKTRDLAGDGFLFRAIDQALPKGARTPLGICELMGVMPGNDELPEHLWAEETFVRLAQAWRPAYELYLARDWGQAHTAFAEICRQFPDDRPAALLAERCNRFVSAPPASSWDGVTRHEHK